METVTTVATLSLPLVRAIAVSWFVYRRFCLRRAFLVLYDQVA